MIRSKTVLSQTKAEWAIYNDLDLDQLYPETWRNDKSKERLDKVIEMNLDEGERVYKFEGTHDFAGYAITDKGKVLTSGHLVSQLGFGSNDRKLFILKNTKRYPIEDLIEDAGFTYDHERVCEMIKETGINVARMWYHGNKTPLTILERNNFDYEEMRG